MKSPRKKDDRSSGTIFGTIVRCKGNRMKVRELIDALLKEDLEAEVIQTGEHGPSPWSGDIEKGKYMPENTWTGEWFSFDEAPEESVDAIYIQPIN